MALALWTLLAEDAPKQQTPQGGPPDFLLFYVIAIVFLIWMMFLRPRRQDADRRAFQASLKKNDKVEINGGWYGTILAISDKEDEVTVKLDENLRLRMSKNAIVRKFEEPKEGAPKEGGA